MNEQNLLKGTDEHMRIDLRFFEEMREIKEDVKQNTKSNKKCSDRVITSLFVRHNYFPKIKKDVIRYLIESEEGTTSEEVTSNE